MARRDDRGYREYLREEQRSQPGCPARESFREPLGRDTSRLQTSSSVSRPRVARQADCRVSWVNVRDVTFSPSARGRLTRRDLDRFPDQTLFHRLARAVCHAGCLPRKELYEAWEMARRVRRLFRGGRVVDLGAGHGLLAQVLLLLDDSSSSALVVD